MSTMLGIPPQALWERIPGVTDDDLERWKTLAAEGDALTSLTATLERQAAALQPEPAAEPVPAGT